MIVLLGFLGLAQALVLPGWIAARTLGVRGAIRTSTASLALSLILNFALVALLVALDGYRRDVLLVLFAIECMIAWRLTSRPGGAHARADSTPVPLAERAADQDARPALRLSLPEMLAALAVIALAIWYFGRIARAASGIFSGWDDLASWNRWALDWARGTWPRHTWHYPQIVPVAWSLTYRFTGSEVVQGFARGMMPAFGLAAMLALLDLARGPRRLAYFAAAWFAGSFLARVNNVTAGLADLPVAFLGLAALGEYLREPEADSVPGAAPNIAWLYAAGAGLAKQAGLYVAVVLPILFALRRPKGERLRPAARDYARIAAVLAPWYVLKQIQIAMGLETSEVGHVLTGAHHSASLVARASGGFARLAEISGGWPVLASLVLLALVGMRERRARMLMLAIGAPFTVLWALAFSYDPRNLSVALPVWAIACGEGAAWLLSRLPASSLDVSGFVPGLSARARRLAPAALLVLAVVLLALRFPDRDLVAHARRLQLGLGDPEMNRTLDSLRSAGRLAHVVSDPGYLLAYAPGWDSSFTATSLTDARRFVADAARPGVRSVLLRRDAPIAMSALMDTWREQGAWRLAHSTAAADLWQRR